MGRNNSAPPYQPLETGSPQPRNHSPRSPDIPARASGEVKFHFDNTDVEFRSSLTKFDEKHDPLVVPHRLNGLYREFNGTSPPKVAPCHLAYVNGAAQLLVYKIHDMRAPAESKGKTDNAWNILAIEREGTGAFQSAYAMARTAIIWKRR